MIDITVVFKDGVLESVLNETEYKSLYTDPNNIEADSDRYQINNMHAQEER